MEQQEKLILEIENKRREYRTDNYPMSIGELISMYRSGEIIINPEFQRYFRWTDIQKTKLIESILLGIPIPSIFVFQRKDGKWEVVDGLQRISSILQFVGELEKTDKKTLEKEKYLPLKLEKTKYLPSLEGILWETSEENQLELPLPLKLQFKRAKLNFTIILPESDEEAKFEVFQRLNRCGTFATNQELRNCIMVMVNKDIFEWLGSLANNEHFLNTTALPPRLIEEQYHLELVLKYLTCRYYTYNSRKDVSENLDETMQNLLTENQIKTQEMKQDFEKLFLLLDTTVGENIFKKYTDSGFKGRFLESAFEAIVIGIGSNINSYNEHDEKLIKTKVKELWNDMYFLENIGSGSNAKTRLPTLIDFSKKFFGK